MRNQVLAAAFALSFIAAPLAVRAQVVNDTVNGAARGANEGEDVGGPVGGVVGGAVGAGVGAAPGAVGTAAGLVGGGLGVGDRPRFREEVVREHRPSFRFAQPVRAGVILPQRGITYYDVPPQYRVKPGYRYTIVNDRPVIVEPRTRRIVEVIE